MRPDPLVLEIAETLPVVQSLPVSPGAVLSGESAEPDAPVHIDEQLLLDSGDPTPPATKRTSDSEAADRPVPWLLELMVRVQLPTLLALSTASLEPLRAALRRVSESDDPQLWAVYHVLLGGALRLRSYRARGSARAKLLIEATRAFDTAYSVYAPLKAGSTARFAELMSSFPMQTVGGPRHRPGEPCIGDKDGTTLIARVVTGPVGQNTHLLERAILSLRIARAAADIASWTWVSSTNNLACALTLLGNRVPARAGTQMLEEAARVLHEALRAHAAGHQRQDRGSTLVNLAEALLSMAEREVPAQRIRQIEHAFMASSAALRTVVPADMAWLVNLERRSIE
jgi:hypothetical protein